MCGITLESAKKCDMLSVIIKFAGFPAYALDFGRIDLFWRICCKLTIRSVLFCPQAEDELRRLQSKRRKRTRIRA